MQGPVTGSTGLAAAFERRAKNLLKSELRRRGVTYAELARRLTELGLPQSVRTMSNRLSRGGFSAALLLQALHVIGTKVIRLD
jgi:hypothetical protein